MVENWKWTPLDQDLAEDLQAFLPPRVIDSHAHIYRISDLNVPPTHAVWEGPETVTIAAWKTFQERQLGANRLAGGLITGFPTANGKIESINEFLRSQLTDAPDCRGLLVVSPDETARTGIESLLNHPQIVGFKPYHCYSPIPPTYEAPLDSYLPEWIWRIAHERKLIILLHLVKNKALTDPDNQKTILDRCRKYPNAQLILAHAGRGFHSPNTVKGISALRGLENIWFDTAAVCEPEAIAAILREFGPRKVLWGSDFPVSEMRGKCVSVGDNFVWLDQSNIPWEKLAPSCSPTVVGLESLRAIHAAATYMNLNQEDLADIFYHNARRLLKFDPAETNKTQALYRHAKERIPGGTQLLSKRPEMLAPDQWPAYFREARGCEVWDLDGRHYYDMGTNGIGACLLGFRDPDVTRAVLRRVEMGSMCTLNSPEEVELADLLCQIHPWAGQARFTRSGGEAMATAVRIARASTDRSIMAICGYHGWHDWYLAANLGEADALRGHLLPGLNPLGVPRELRGTAITFGYNDREAFSRIIKQHGGQLAAVVMEPCRYTLPEPGFLDYVREEAHKVGALLVFDEITIGWRLCLGGSHLKLGVNPDIAVFAKALGNGHPIGAIIGTKEAMNGAHDSFISSTYWTESVGPVAALATLQKMKETKVWNHVEKIGDTVAEAWKTHATKYKVPVVVEPSFACFAHFKFDHPLAPELKTLYTQLMLERGFLAGTVIYATLAHTHEILNMYSRAIEDVFQVISRGLTNGNVEKLLKGPVAHSGFRRLL